MNSRNLIPVSVTKILCLLAISSGVVLIIDAPGALGGEVFRRGDTNTDASRDLSDVIFTLDFLFRSGPRHACDDAADVNDDESIDTSDAVWLLWFLFLGADAPPTPGADCGADPTGDGLKCEGYTSCPQVDFGDFVADLFENTSDDADPVEVNDIDFCFDDAVEIFDEVAQP